MATEQVVEESAQQEDASSQSAKTNAQSVALSEAPESQETSASGNIDILLDMTVPVTVRIGQTSISVRQLLQLKPGSVLKLDESIDTPAAIYLKDAKFAVGDVVVVDEKFAVRVKQILSVEGPGVQESEA
jgi:flagellar motor switch protein FliN/FliY